MRKLLALLLAVMLAVMPAASLAEKYKINTKFAFDSEALAPALEQMISMIAEMSGEDPDELLEGMDANQLAEAVALLMNATSFELNWQPDGVRVVCNMQDKYVCSVFIMWTEDEIAMSSNLLPDLKLTLPLAEVKEAMAELLSVDWAAVVDDAVSRVVRWATAQRADVLQGSFAGDAYEGGTKSVQYAITDADIADLMESIVLGVESNDALMELLGSMFGESDVNKALRDFREYNLNVELESEYHYTLNMVYNANDMLIGLSLNVLEGEELITTVSLGANEAGDTCKLVVGVPLGSGVVYVDADLALLAEDGTETMKFAFGVYQSDKLISYQQAAQDAFVLVQRQTITAAVQPVNGGQVNTIVSEYTGWIAQRVEIVQTIADEPFSFEEIRKVWLGDGTAPLAVMTTTAEPSAAHNSFQDGLTEIDLTRLSADSDLEEKLQAALDEGVKTVAISLFQALPPQLMTLFIQMQ